MKTKEIPGRVNEEQQDWSESMKTNEIPGRVNEDQQDCSVSQ